jgi:NADPH:quinone reductase-like Zn-dependent oxidoreductase
MKAVTIHSFGGPEVLQLEDLPTPELGDDDVLVDVRAASVNPVDYKTRAGKFPPVTTAQLPKVLGRDVAGVVERCGAHVDVWQPGAEVYAMLDQNHGGYAQRVAVHAALCARRPRNLSFVEAAAVPLAGLTAWQGLFEHGRLQAGQTVLIHGGAGGVGHFAIQFAKVHGARVATTVSRGDLDFVRELGADVIIDRDAGRFEDQIRAVDLVFDLVGGAVQKRSFDVLKPHGTLVTTLGRADETTARERGLRVVTYMTRADGEQLAEITHWIEAAKVRPRLQETFALDDARGAQERAEHQHTQGKIVLEVRA